MKKTLLLIMTVLLMQFARSQNSAPVAVNDTVNTIPGTYITINAVENDYDPDGDAFRIFLAEGSESFTDSTITYHIPWDYQLNEAGYIEYSYKLLDENFQTGSESNALVVIGVKDDYYNYLDVNNIRAQVNSFGNHFNNFHKYTDTIRYEFPKGSGINTIYNSALWIGGYDQSGQLRVAGERYRQLGIDFWSGPLSTDGTASIDTNTVREWRRVWKINRSQVIQHAENWNDPGYEAPEVILNWPAHGDTTLNQSYYLAPFVDVNQNGDYEPMQGDFPLIRGNQAIFFIFNDQKEHTETGGLPIGIEIHGMAWAYTFPKSSIALENTIFFSYKIFNRSNQKLNDAYLGVNCDFDIGYAFDDFVGCDVQRGAYYGYNGDDYDEIDEPGYGDRIPAQGIVVLGGPEMDPDNIDNPDGNCDESINGVHFGDGIVDNERYGMNSFMYYQNTGNIMGDPFYTHEYMQYMKGIWKDSTVMEYGGNGHVNFGAYGPACKFMFPGMSDTCFWGTGGIEPYGPVNWTEETAGNEPYDRRGLSAMGPFTLNPGDMQKVDIAFVTARTSEPGNSVDLLMSYIDEVRSFYFEDPENFGFDWLSTNEQKIENNFRVFPNPCNNEITLMLDNELKRNSPYVVYNMYGGVVLTGKIQNGSTNHKIRLNGLKKGFYIIEIQSGSWKHTSKFLKN